MKKSLATLLALAMMASLTACGGSSDTQSTTAAETTAAETPAAETTAAETTAAETTAAETSAAAEGTEQEAASALSSIALDMADTNIETGHVALVTFSQYLYSEAEDGKSSASCSYDLPRLGEGMEEAYPELATGLDNYAQDINDTYTSDYEELKTSAASSAEDRGDDLTEELACYIGTESSVVRADSNVVSLYNEYYDYKGGAHGYYYYYGTNFDTATGAVLTLDDVVKDKDALIAYLKEELVKQYPDVQFTGLDEFFSNSETVNAIFFLCRYDGVEFFFAPYDLASYADGAQSILVPADRTDLLNEKYLDFPETYVTAIGTEAPFYCDTDGDGNLETVQVDVEWVDDDSDQRNYTVSLDDASLFVEAYAYGVAPYIVVTKDGAYLYVQEQSDNDYMLTMVYDISGSEPTEVTDGDTTFFGAHAMIDSDETSSSSEGYYHKTYEWTDPAAMLMTGHIDVLKTTTGAKLYSVGKSGIPQTEQKNYVILPELTVTAKKDLSLMKVDNTLADVEETTVASGTVLTLYLSDGDSTAYLLDTATNTLYKVTLDKSEWPYTLNGEPDEDCFDGVAYAG